MFPQNGLELISQCRRRIPLLEWRTDSLLYAREREYAQMRGKLDMCVHFRPDFSLRRPSLPHTSVEQKIVVRRTMNRAASHAVNRSTQHVSGYRSPLVDSSQEIFRFLQRSAVFC